MTLYSNAQLRTIAFPIGGIGTGCFSLSGRGALVDWEIFHRPNKSCLLPNTFFSIWTRTARGAVDARVLESWPDVPLIGDVIGSNYYGFGFGARRETGAGLRHMQGNTFRGEYPFAWVDFADPALPVQVSLMAYNPFIPLNVEDSGLPVGIFAFTLTNPGSEDVEVSLAANLFNAVGYRGYGAFSYVEHGEFKGTGKQNVNRFIQEPGLSAIVMSSEHFTPDKPYGGTMALATPWQDISHQTAWLRGAWFDSLQVFWDEFSSTGRLADRVYADPSPENVSDTGSLALHVVLKPGESQTLPLLMAWHFPHFIKYWADSYRPAGPDSATWRVPYARRFGDALEVARYAAQHEARLRRETQAFHDALFDSTLPVEVVDAVTSQMSILKSPTVTLLEDGSFYGFEGVHSTAGCCEGSCQHVWNYALTHAYLFPQLERSMRHNDYVYNQFEDGRMIFRLSLPLGSPPLDFHPAADGQMGGVMQVYRDWKLSGDTEWLRGLWHGVKRSLEYAWRYWDYNQDGVMEGLQHNTYDIEFFGPNSMMQSWYLGALRCGAEMARAVGEDSSAQRYAALAEVGARWTDQNLFNGSYYEQRIDPEAARYTPFETDRSLGGQRAGVPKYQYGSGCLSDQVIGAWMARVCGIGSILDRDHVLETLRAIYRHNFRASLADHHNAQRVFALGNEAGLLLCTWPNGSRPDLPFVYSDEVWTGIEYQVASHMMYEGLIEEGLAIVAGARARYDGQRRNPWNEIECGSHYARALASWGLLLALSGFECDLTVDHVGFKPAWSPAAFRCFWSTGSGWGTYSQDETRAQMHCDYGRQTVRSWRVGLPGVTAVQLDGADLPAQYAAVEGGTLITLPAAAQLRPGVVMTTIRKE